MTTIAFKNGSLAVDRQASDGGLRYTTRQKSFKTRGGTVYAIAGSLACGLSAVEWIKGAREDSCPLDDDTIVIEFCTITGRLLVWEAPGYPVEHVDAIGAWGSGNELAIGAMAAGATPEEAVEIAAEWDSGTGMGVDVYEHG